MVNLFSPEHSLVWVDHPKNPLIHPPFYSPIIGDPTILTPKEAHDARFHLFAFSLLGIEQYASLNGISWEKQKTKGLPWIAARPFIYHEDKTYYLFYEKIDLLVPYTSIMRSHLELVTSSDLKTWSEPRVILEPVLDWFEGVCGNPCLVKDLKGYRLYFSAGKVFLDDCLFLEPKHIGVAFSDSILGPYEPHKTPLISPSTSFEHLNLGAGSIKVKKVGNGYSGFINGIYKDAQGRSRSAIKQLFSTDGIGWDDYDSDHIIKYSAGWKNALVYAFDVKEYNGKLWLYYNARDGWFLGKERIGLATASMKI